MAGCGRYPDALLVKDLGFQGDLANIWRYREDRGNTAALREGLSGDRAMNVPAMGTDETLHMAPGIDSETEHYSKLQVTLGPQEIAAVCKVGGGICDSEGDAGGATCLQRKAGMGWGKWHV